MRRLFRGTFRRYCTSRPPPAVPPPTPTRGDEQVITELPDFPDVTSPATMTLFSPEETNTLAELLYFEHYSHGEVGTKDDGLIAARAELGWLMEWAESKGDGAKEAVRRAVVERADHHTPIQYILGNQPFMSLNVLCRAPVFIPRPETEAWLHWLIRDHLARHRQRPLRIVDLCSGTGAIGLALAQYSPSWKVWCVELTDEAFALSEENKRENNITNCQILQGDMFHALARAGVYGTVDLIVSNPPYITQKEFLALPRVVKEHESTLSLFGEKPTDDAMQYYNEIALRGKDCLKPFADRAPLSIGLLVEVGSQGVPVAECLEANGWVDVDIHHDYAGKPRWVVATPTPPPPG